MGGFLGGWFGGPVRRMVPAYQPSVFDGEDARAVQSPRGGVREEVYSLYHKSLFASEKGPVQIFPNLFFHSS